MATNSYLNTIGKHANKNKERIKKLQTFDLSYFFGNFFW